MNSNLHIATVTEVEIPGEIWKGYQVTCPVCGKLGEANNGVGSRPDAYDAAQAHTTEHAEAGMPATINLYSDTIAAVVTRKSATSVWVRRVELNESTQRPAGGYDQGPYPVLTTDGDLSKPFGDEERYTWSEKKRGYYKGSLKLTLGASYRLVDYRM
jgi:hypothetical protein